jgi:hypothetical protein
VHSTIADLYAACRSSGVPIRLKPIDAEIRLSDIVIVATDRRLDEPDDPDFVP